MISSQHYFHHPATNSATEGISRDQPGIDGILPTWVTGSVSLPPGAIKDAEGVGKYLQVFFVSQGALQGLEVGFAHPQTDEWVEDTAQRLLLSPGDSFYVPPGNIYRLENHSIDITAVLYWMIVYPVEESGESRVGQTSSSSSTSLSNHTVIAGTIINK